MSANEAKRIAAQQAILRQAADEATVRLVATRRAAEHVAAQRLAVAQTLAQRAS